MVNNAICSILLVDNSSLRRAALQAFLHGWLEDKDAKIFDFNVADASDHLEIVETHQLILLSVGGSSLEDSENKKSIRMLKGVAPDTPIAIIGEREDADEILAALRLGAAAYLPTSMETDFAVHCLTFLRHGGAYFPPPALQSVMERCNESGGAGPAGKPADPKQGQAARPAEATPTIKRTDGNVRFSIQRLQDAGATNGNKLHRLAATSASAAAARPCQNQRRTTEPPASRPADSPCSREVRANGSPLANAAPTPSPADAASEKPAVAPGKVEGYFPELTSRQREVLLLLVKGASNKNIARKLAMTESTVKVHVHQIIKKFGASNRTEVVANIYKNPNVPREFM